MRRTRKDIEQVQDRRAEVVKLRAEGRTFDEIAALTGFANSSGAWKCWQAAIRQRPDASVDEVRRQERTRLEAMDSALAKIIASPPAKTTAIGKTVVDPDSGEIVRDQQVVVASIRARLALGESYRRLTGADAASAGPSVVVDQRSVSVMLLEINQDRQLRGHPPLPVIPGFTE